MPPVFLKRETFLWPQEEKVLLQDRVLGLPSGVRQVLVWRIGAPLYRLQLEAAKMRLRVRRRHLDTSAGEPEEFFIDPSVFPESAFEPFTRAERQRILLHVLEGPPEAQQLPEPTALLPAAAPGTSLLSFCLPFPPRCWGSCHAW